MITFGAGSKNFLNHHKRLIIVVGKRKLTDSLKNKIFCFKYDRNELPLRALQSPQIVHLQSGPLAMSELPLLVVYLYTSSS